jgi:hypothetical protein
LLVFRKFEELGAARQTLHGYSRRACDGPRAARTGKRRGSGRAHQTRNAGLRLLRNRVAVHIWELSPV